MSEILVADISRWQYTINWDEFRKHISGVVIKASGGDNILYRDGMLSRNQAEARRVGVPIWYYHYKGPGNPEAEADFFLQQIGELKQGEGLVLDDENEGTINVEWDRRFAKRIIERTGIRPVIYSNAARITAVGNAAKVLVDMNLGLWVAKYGINNGTRQGAGSMPGTGAWPGMAMWQYTSAARIPGVSQNTVDMNVFFGSVADFKAYGSKTGGKVSQPVNNPQPSTGSGGGATVTVQPGDTLSGIAARLGTTVASLVALNGIANPNLIFVGQVLRTGGSPQTAATSAAQTGKVHVVMAGETLSGIAAKYGTTVQRLAQINGISNPNFIVVGQKISLGNAAPAPSGGRSYTVQKGDNLSAIAAKFGTNWATLARINGIADPSLIYPGQVIKIG